MGQATLFCPAQAARSRSSVVDHTMHASTPHKFSTQPAAGTHTFARSWIGTPASSTRHKRVDSNPCKVAGKAWQLAPLLASMRHLCRTLQVVAPVLTGRATFLLSGLASSSSVLAPVWPDEHHPMPLFSSRSLFVPAWRYMPAELLFLQVWLHRPGEPIFAQAWR